MTTHPAKRGTPSWIKVTVPLALILGVSLVALQVIKSKVGQPQTDSSASVGSVLPDFTLRTLEGKETRFSALTSNKLYVINFWATWCEACVEEMPSLVRLREHFKGKGLEVLGINVDENPKAVVPSMIDELKITFPIYSDPEGRIAELFDVHSIPLTAVLTKQGKVLLIENGEKQWDSSEMKALIEKWIAQ